MFMVFNKGAELCLNYLSKYLLLAVLTRLFTFRSKVFHKITLEYSCVYGIIMMYIYPQIIKWRNV